MRIGVGTGKQSETIRYATELVLASCGWVRPEGCSTAVNNAPCPVAQLVAFEGLLQKVSQMRLDHL